ncbi:hypothetical protein AOLI_G00247160 [Acnodon oligacanthus]
MLVQPPLHSLISHHSGTEDGNENKMSRNTQLNLSEDRSRRCLRRETAANKHRRKTAKYESVHISTGGWQVDSRKPVLATMEEAVPEKHSQHDRSWGTEHVACPAALMR